MDDRRPPPPPRPRPAAPPPAHTPALERQELLERKEATRRAIQRNASQARGELERGHPDEVIRITGLMLRGKSLRTLATPQIPLVYFRGRAFEALDEPGAARACYRAVAAWDGGSMPLVEDAKPFIDRALNRLLALHEGPPGAVPKTPPARDPRVFPRPYITAGRLIAAIALTGVMLACSALLVGIFKL